MAWWKRERMDADSESSLRKVAGSGTRVLAWGRSGDGYCAMLPGALAVKRSAQTDWEVMAWHDIERGEWNADTQSLRWELVDGRRGSVVLDDAADLPLVFRDRMRASVLVDEFVDIPGTRNGGRVTARRDLTDRDRPIVWRTVRSRGTPDTPEVRAALELRLDQLRTLME